MSVLRDELGPDDYDRKARAVREYCRAEGYSYPLCRSKPRTRNLSRYHGSPLMGHLWFRKRATS